MDLKLERAGAAVVVRVEKGTLVVEEDTSELHDLVRALTIFDPGCSVIVDLERLHRLDCSGIGQLMQMRRQISDLGGVFALLNLPRRHRRLLEMLGLLRVLPAFASREEAVTACWSAQARGNSVPARWFEGWPLRARPPAPGRRAPALEL
jgi:anti-anti-sigma factor